MGTQLVGPCVKEDIMEIPSIPPGFESLVSFTVKRVDDNKLGCYSSSASIVEPQTVKLETDFDCKDDLKTMKSHRRRPGIKYKQFDSSGDDNESDQVGQV